jgi:hypothetical protein
MGASRMTRKRRADIVQLIVTAIRLGAPVAETCRAYNMPVRRFGNLVHFVPGWYQPEMADCHAAVSLAVRQELEAIAQQQAKEERCSTE